MPEELIAQEPLGDRSASRLLVVNKGSGDIHHCRFADATSLLRAGDLLVVNDTRVSAVRLFGHRPTGGVVEALLIARRASGTYEALLRPGRRLPVGARIDFEAGLTASVEDQLPEGRKLIRFDTVEGFDERLEAAGIAPLPPYIHRKLGDRERYQTVYGTEPGSAAAPTAGLHFTKEILQTLQQNGVEIANVTLHVGLDTFRPVQVQDPALHPIHGELCAISGATAEKIRGCQGRIIGVGTTTVRTLESFAKGRREVEAGQKTSRLFIRPGFEFNIVDGMFTNFHMPRTTMMMMISALAGRDVVMTAYEEAIREKYRFLSFGDSMLIL